MSSTTFNTLAPEQLVAAAVAHRHLRVAASHFGWEPVTRPLPCPDRPALLGRMPMRDFGAQRHPDVLPARVFETRPTLAVLSTAHDRRADWLRAGQALERVLLSATRRGVRASFLRQALEWPDLRGVLPAGSRTVQLSR